MDFFRFAGKSSSLREPFAENAAPEKPDLEQQRLLKLEPVPDALAFVSGRVDEVLLFAGFLSSRLAQNSAKIQP